MPRPEGTDVIMLRIAAAALLFVTCAVSMAGAADDAATPVSGIAEAAGAAARAPQPAANAVWSPRSLAEPSRGGLLPALA